MKANTLPLALVGIVAICALPMCGCGSSTPEFGSAPDEVIQLVGCIPDSARSPQTFAVLFSSTTPPDDAKRQQMMPYTYVARSAKVSGDEATVKVEVRNRSTSEPIGEMEWTAVKEGGNWKLRDTPLPAK